MLNESLGSSVTQMPTNIRSQYTPAIANYNGTLIAVWRGEGDIDGLYWATTQDLSNWIHHGPIADCTSSFQHSLYVTMERPFWRLRARERYRAST